MKLSVIQTILLLAITIAPSFSVGNCEVGTTITCDIVESTKVPNRCYKSMLENPNTKTAACTGDLIKGCLYSKYNGTKAVCGGCDSENGYMDKTETEADGVTECALAKRKHIL